MLKPLPNSPLVREEDRCRFADGEMALTIWFDEDEEIFAFELVFDLLLDEFAVRYTKGQAAKYLRISEGELKPGRHVKQVLGTCKLSLPNSRLTEFNARSIHLPVKIRNLVCSELENLVNDDGKTGIDD